MLWQPGHRLRNGQYEIGNVLGQGGFGITYKALHTQLRSQVVIKTPNAYIKHDPDYEKYVERFIKEGRMLEKFSQEVHPNIVRVRDLFEEADVHCLVMDFIEGENLFQMVKRRGPISEAEIVPWICQIGEALCAVHEAGLVHRDAHPGNIIIRPNGRAMLIDFGIAKELTPSTQSSTGIAGNQGFAPYEQLMRGSREPNVDVYCLASTLYFAVTGTRPVTSLDRRLYNTTLIAPKQLNPKIGDTLNQALIKGMALEADDRPKTMQSWLMLLQSSPVINRPKDASPPPARLIRSNPFPESPKPQPSQQQKQAQAKPKVAQRFFSKGFLLRKKLKAMPWGWLIFAASGYSVIGYVLGAEDASILAWAPILAWALAWALAGTGALAWALTVALALTVAGAVAGAVVVALAGAVAVAWVGAGTWVGNKLLLSFNRFHTFLILFTTAIAGLASGWLS